MIHRLVLISILLAIPIPAAAGQLIARVELGRYTLSLVAIGDRYNEGCGLDLVAESHKFRRAVSLKHPIYNCATYGAVQVTASHLPGEETPLVFVEASRGGDGDHTPPIVEIFRLGLQGFRRIGRVELLDATYIRDGRRISALTGKVLFNFCDTCDGWEVSPAVVFVPARVTILPDKILVSPNLDPPAKAAIVAQFDAVKAEALSENKGAQNETAKYAHYVQLLEHRFRDFLDQ
jgi:hypothetical protein